LNRYNVRITLTTDKDHIEMMKELSIIENRNISELIRWLVEEQLKRRHITEELGQVPADRIAAR